MAKFILNSCFKKIYTFAKKNYTFAKITINLLSKYVLSTPLFVWK